MKKIILITSMMFICIYANSQKVEIPKKANVIYVEIDYSDLGRLLVENEYEIASSSKDFGSIVTEYKMLKNSYIIKYHVKIKATQKNDQMKLTMLFKTTSQDKNALNHEDSELDYRGSNKKLFQKVVDIFEGYKVECTKED